MRDVTFELVEDTIKHFTRMSLSNIASRTNDTRLKTTQKTADSDWLVLLLSGGPRLDFRPKDWLFESLVGISGTTP
jgi:hypothetical protein